MTRVFTDGAETGDVAFWTAVGGIQIYSAIKRNGAYCYRAQPGVGTLATRTITEKSEFYYRVGIYFEGAGATESFMRFLNSSVIIGQVYRDISLNVLKAYVGAALVATGT